ncbi:MAG: purine-nucleoside phosphorylase [Lachnospiraceae bacterium]|nr:purine-nucleoside phosphorylase [Lachnospiraceae bacterium]
MTKVYEKLMGCFESVKERIPFEPKVALVLGSGLGDYAENVGIEGVIEYRDIEGFPVSTAPGHKGRFVFFHIGNVPVVAMQGRIHYYEGYDMTDVVLPIRLMKLMGAEILFITNASGGIQQGLKAGDLMLIKDQISFFVPSPLRGPNVDELGARFPDMSKIYDPELSMIVKRTAMNLGIDLKEGVYLQTTGPNYETPAEITFARTMGADVVGMSTACEAIAANHMGMRIVGVASVSNLASGISAYPLSEEEVIAAGKAIEKSFSALVTESILNFQDVD